MLSCSSLVPRPFWEGETTWHSSSEVHVILLIFSPAENGPFLLVEATVCAGSATEGKQKSNEQKVVVQSTFTSAIERSTINGHDCDVSTHDAIRFTVVM